MENVGSNPTWSTTKCWVNLLMARRGAFQASDDGSIPSPSTKCGCGVMVATLGSEPSDRKVIWVRLPSSAPALVLWKLGLGHIHRGQRNGYRQQDAAKSVSQESNECHHGGVAQLVEHQTEDLGVTGSIPVSTTGCKKTLNSSGS